MEESGHKATEKGRVRGGFIIPLPPSRASHQPGGVHGEPATLHLETLWIKNVTITTGLVNTSSTPTLLKLVSEGRLDPTPFATHNFKLNEIMDAYDVFADAANTNAMKVVLSS